MTVGVLKITGVTAPKCITGELDYFCTCFLRLLHNTINFFLAVYIVTNGKFCSTR